MLGKRILSLVLGFAFTIGVILYNNNPVINVVMCVFMAIAVNEFDRAFREKENKPMPDIAYLTVVGMFAINILRRYDYITLDVSAIYLYIFYPIVFLITFGYYVVEHRKYSVIDLSLTILQIIYCVLMFSYIINMFDLPNGNIYIWYVFIGSWFTDIFAYCVGRLVGKRHFTSISPNKTIEGSVGGIIGCIISLEVFTYILNTTLSLGLDYEYILVLAILCSIISQIGDLFASSIKRFTGVKDFGNFFPGHGGIIDRFDSTIFVAPFVYAFFYLLF